MWASAFQPNAFENDAFQRGIYNAYVYMTPGAGGQLRAKCGLFEITAL